LCLNGKLPWTMARWADFPDQCGPVYFKLSISKVRVGKSGVKGTLVLLVRRLRTYPLSQIGVINRWCPIKYGCSRSSPVVSSNNLELPTQPRVFRLYLDSPRTGSLTCVGLFSPA